MVILSSGGTDVVVVICNWDWSTNLSLSKNEVIANLLVELVSKKRIYYEYIRRFYA